MFQLRRMSPHTHWRRRQADERSCELRLPTVRTYGCVQRLLASDICAPAFCIVEQRRPLRLPSTRWAGHSLATTQVTALQPRTVQTLSVRWTKGSRGSPAILWRRETLLDGLGWDGHRLATGLAGAVGGATGWVRWRPRPRTESSAWSSAEPEPSDGAVQRGASASASDDAPGRRP